jgi:hypothetical protein
VLAWQELREHEQSTDEKPEVSLQAALDRADHRAAAVHDEQLGAVLADLIEGAFAYGIVAELA